MPSLKLMLTMDIMDMLDMGMPLTLTATDTEPTDHTDTDTDMELTGVKNKTNNRNHSWLNFPVSWYFLAKIGMGISNK